MNNVAIFGDVIVDKYVDCDVTRISPEAPVPVLKYNDFYFRLGGAANVALNLINFNCKVTLYCILGDDENRKVIQDFCEKYSIKLVFITSKDKPTILKTRYLSQNKQLFRLDNEEEFDSSERADLEKSLIDNINCYDLLIISDYDKGTFKPDFNFIKNLKLINSRLKVVVDPKKSNWHYYSYADYITPNRSEFNLVSKYSSLNINLFCKKLSDDYNINNVLLTKSEDGLTLYCKGNELCSYNANLQEVIDVTGAGDTVISSFAFKLLDCDDPSYSALFANYAAGISCSYFGTHAPTLNEIELELNNYKETVVFTNGCFDIIHLGHLRYLEHARKLGSKLIVGINSDLSVKRLKGDDRPINNQETRRNILLSLDFVDEVIIFDEDTPLNLISVIKPNILVKGGDYVVEEIIGYDLVISNGGSVVTLPFLNGYSTSLIISKSDKNHV